MLLDNERNDVTLRHNNVMSAAEQLVRRTCDALADGEIAANQLTARQLGAFLGKTTSVLYHHWGSLDGFLFAVAQAGFSKFGSQLTAGLQQTGSLENVAEAFVCFGLDRRVLYHVMFERHFDWDALRAAGTFEKQIPGMSLWAALTTYLAGAGSSDPDGDARILYAAIHGLVSLANSGRANVGALGATDRNLAIRAARKLARRLAPANTPPTPTTSSNRRETA